ncbi:ABC transporter substrate-binding protein [Bosea sp. LjRoot237]|uniref:ABC transporter substrate-binding protein n=1 Tax=Bosea sp. LjRoot237 TaxID=3342292 RepID=UPI003ECE45F7
MRGYALAGLIGATLAIAAPAPAEEIAIGSHMPLTGTIARSGQAFREGMLVGIKVFNDSQSKHQIKVSLIDDESQPAKAVGAVEKLVSDGAVAIIGGYGSNIVGPASDASNRLGKVYITAGAVSEELVQRGHKTFFRINNNSGYQRGFETMVDELKPNGVSVIASTKEATMLLGKGLEDALTKKGVKVTLHPFDPAITDFKPIINKVKLQDKSDIIFMSAYENDYVGIIRAAKVLKPQVKLIVGAWSLAIPKMFQDFPDLMENVVGTTPLAYPVDVKDEESKRFVAAFKAMFNKDIDYANTLSYVQTMVICEALARAADAGTLKSGGLAEEMRKTKRSSPLGQIVFNEVGDNPSFSLSMGQHRQGKIVLVSPAEQATGPITYPGLPW